MPQSAECREPAAVLACKAQIREIVEAAAPEKIDCNDAARDHPKRQRRPPDLASVGCQEDQKCELYNAIGDLCVEHEQYEEACTGGVYDLAPSAG
ncbi:hypothetical protein D3C87_1835680 [compost metagenome]